MLSFILEAIIHGVICAVFCSGFHILLERIAYGKKKKLTDYLLIARKIISKTRPMILTNSENIEKGCIDPMAEYAKKCREQLKQEILAEFDNFYEVAKNE